MRPIKQPEC